MPLSGKVSSAKSRTRSSGGLQRANDRNMTTEGSGGAKYLSRSDNSGKREVSGRSRDRRSSQAGGRTGSTPRGGSQGSVNKDVTRQRSRQVQVGGLADQRLPSYSRQEARYYRGVVASKGAFLSSAMATAAVLSSAVRVGAIDSESYVARGGAFDSLDDVSISYGQAGPYSNYTFLDGTRAESLVSNFVNQVSSLSSFRYRDDGVSFGLNGNLFQIDGVTRSSDGRYRLDPTFVADNGYNGYQLRISNLPYASYNRSDISTGGVVQANDVILQQMATVVPEVSQIEMVVPEDQSFYTELTNPITLSSGSTGYSSSGYNDWTVLSNGTTIESSQGHELFLVNKQGVVHKLRAGGEVYKVRDRYGDLINGLYCQESELGEMVYRQDIPGPDGGTGARFYLSSNPEGFVDVPNFNEAGLINNFGFTNPRQVGVKIANGVGNAIMLSSNRENQFSGLSFLASQINVKDYRIFSRDHSLGFLSERVYDLGFDDGESYIINIAQTFPLPAIDKANSILLMECIGSAGERIYGFINSADLDSDSIDISFNSFENVESISQMLSGGSYTIFDVGDDRYYKLLPGPVESQYLRILGNGTVSVIDNGEAIAQIGDVEQSNARQNVLRYYGAEISVDLQGDVTAKSLGAQEYHRQTTTTTTPTSTTSTTRTNTDGSTTTTTTTKTKDPTTSSTTSSRTETTTSSTGTITSSTTTATTTSATRTSSTKTTVTSTLTSSSSTTPTYTTTTSSSSITTSGTTITDTPTTTHTTTSTSTPTTTTSSTGTVTTTSTNTNTGTSTTTTLTPTSSTLTSTTTSSTTPTTQTITTTPTSTTRTTTTSTGTTTERNRDAGVDVASYWWIAVVLAGAAVATGAIIKKRRQQGEEVQRIAADGQGALYNNPVYGNAPPPRREAWGVERGGEALYAALPDQEGSGRPAGGAYDDIPGSGRHADGMYSDLPNLDGQPADNGPEYLDVSGDTGGAQASDGAYDVFPGTGRPADGMYDDIPDYAGDRQLTDLPGQPEGSYMEVRPDDDGRSAGNYAREGVTDERERPGQVAIGAAALPLGGGKKLTRETEV